MGQNWFGFGDESFGYTIPHDKGKEWRIVADPRGVKIDYRPIL